MKELLTLLKLQYKKSSIRWPEMKGRKLSQMVAAFILLVAVFVGFFYVMLKVSVPFYKLDLEKTYLTFVIALLLIISLIYQTVAILKNFYYDKDHELYAKLPVQDWKIKSAKSIYIISKQVLLVVIYFGFLVFPFAIIANYTMSFYVKIMITALVLIPLPFVGAVLISIPAFFILNLLKRNLGVSLGAVIVLLGAFYYFYTNFISIVMDLINNSGGFINQDQLTQIQNVTNGLYISNLFYLIITEVNVGLFILYILAILLILLLIGMFANILLMKLSTKLVERRHGRQKIYKPKKIKQSNQFVAILKKELITIVRNSDYGFQVIVLNLLMPVFMVMTVRVTAQLGAQSVGIMIIPGVALLTTLIFILISSNFQSNLISSEKNAYYIGLILPIRYRYYLLTRIVLPISLNIVMMTTGLIILTVTNMITIGQFFLILGISFFFLMGFSTISIYKDYKAPEYHSGVGQSANYLTNVSIGLVFAIILGLILSILPFFNEKRPGGYYFPIELTYTLLLAMSFTYFAVTAIMFYRQLKRDRV